MKSVLLVLLGVVIGGALGFFVFTGIGAGVGIATGLQAGACLTLEAAREQGLITAEQEPEILAAAASAFGSEDMPEGVDTSEIDCAKVVADLKAAAEGAE